MALSTRTFDYKVTVPEGVSGDVAIRRFEVTKAAADFERMRAAFNGSRRHVPEGTYTGLYRKGALWMSDTPDEWRDHIEAVIKIADAKTVLIHGLGIGMVLQFALKQPNVESVTVVEIDPDVIKLVQDHYVNMAAEHKTELTILQDDALTWQPPKGSKWDVVWHDIWPDLNTDNLKQMQVLHRRFARRAVWQGSWSREILRSQFNRERADRRRYVW